MFLKDDTDPLIALVYACGLEIGADPQGDRADCPFCKDRIELCQAWLAGFSVGRLARDQVFNSTTVTQIEN